jgi:hypothetical protein
MRNPALILTVAVLAALSSRDAHACTVAPSDNILWDTDISRESAEVVALVRVASSTQTQPSAARVEVIVEHTWKGKVGARWTFTQSLDSTCDYPLAQNTRYVIFANRQEDGRVSVTGVADGALGIIRDRLNANAKPPPSLVTASSSAAVPSKKKR